MKKNKKKKIIIIAVIVIVIAAGAGFLIYRANNLKKMENTVRNNTSTVTEVNVSYRSISKTLSNSGQISSALSENLSLRTGYYLQEVLVSENQYVEKGTNLIEYTNGKFYTAPYSGVVTKFNLPEEEGKITNSHYITMSTTETLQISLSVSEKEIDQIQIGQKVTVVPTAYQNKEYVGYITSVSQIGNYSSSGSTFTVYATFENDGVLKIGMSAKITVILEEAENAMVVPTEAIQKTGNMSFVVKVNSDGSTENVMVTTGISNDAYTQILSGLNGNETLQMIESSGNSSFGGFDISNMPGGFDISDFPSGFGGGNFSGFGGGDFSGFGGGGGNFPSGGGNNFPSGGGGGGGMPSFGN